MSQNAEQVVSVVLCAKVGAYVKIFQLTFVNPMNDDGRYIRAGDFLMGGGM